MSNKRIIELKPEYRGIQSNTFTGRPQGEHIRSELQLNKLDMDEYNYVVSIPNKTTSFNASFYLGLFFKSIRVLGGIGNFKEKYELKILEEDTEIKQGIESDMQDCERQANNEYYGETGFIYNNIHY